MKALPFVKWDRYTDGGPIVYLYGWIDREQDAYKDFVVLEYYYSTADISFVTSSAKYSQEIAKRLFGEASDHEPCLRVEAGFQEFEISNVIKLKNE